MTEKNLEKQIVSIIIPTCNSEETLLECLKSVYSQNYPFYEIIIVDNYSADGTIKIAKRFSAKIIQEKSNPAMARNIGITNATGKYILFLDSDQVLSSPVIEECVEKCKKEKAGMVKIPEIFIGKGFWSFCSATWKNYYEKMGQSCNGHNDESITRGEPRFFVRKELLSVGLLDSALLWGEDYDLYEKLRKMHVKEVICKSKIYHIEPASLKKILIKSFSYGKSLPIFLEKTKKDVPTLLIKQAFLTFNKILKTFRKKLVIIGCATLLFLKACFLAAGVFAGYITKNF